MGGDRGVADLQHATATKRRGGKRTRRRANSSASTRFEPYCEGSVIAADVLWRRRRRAGAEALRRMLVKTGAAVAAKAIKAELSSSEKNCFQAHLQHGASDEALS